MCRIGSVVCKEALYIKEQMPLFKIVLTICSFICTSVKYNLKSAAWLCNSHRLDMKITD